jgi:hypothetical protein
MGENQKGPHQMKYELTEEDYEAHAKALKEAEAEIDNQRTAKLFAAADKERLSSRVLELEWELAAAKDGARANVAQLDADQKRIAELEAEISQIQANPPITDLEQDVINLCLISMVKAREQHVTRENLSYPPLWDAIEALEAARKPKTRTEWLWKYRHHCGSSVQEIWLDNDVGFNFSGPGVWSKTNISREVPE